MKRSTIATTALALAASVFAGSSMAVTVTNVFENFDGKTGAALNFTRTNLTWYADGTDNLSGISNINENAKLYLDTGSDGLVSATLTTNDVNVALAANETATFSARVSFYPSSDDVTPTGGDLRFALYAQKIGSGTNLVAYAKASGAATASQNNTGISIPDTGEKLVAVRIVGTSFYVAVNGGQEAGPYDFITTDSGINKVEFQGNGTVDDVTLAYTSTLAKDAHIDIGNTGSPSHELTATEADYLNSLVGTYGKAAVVDTLADVSEETFEKASLLNQDITKDGAGTYTFEITNIKRKTPTTLTVSATLVRGGTSLGANIRGRAYLYTGTTPNDITTKQSLVEFEFDGETEASADVAIDPAASPFYKVVIEEPPAQ